MYGLKFFTNLPASEKRLTIPTVLTLLRLVSVPIIVFAMVYANWGWAFWLIVLSGLTDILDGYIARNFNQKTYLGACLDPLADKVLILAIYFTLAFCQSPLFSIPVWFVWLVLIKELSLVGGAIWLYKQQNQLEISPTWLGKMTMLVQFLFIVWLFACYFKGWVPIKTYYLVLGLVLVLVLSSLYQYVTIGIKYWFFHSKNKAK